VVKTYHLALWQAQQRDKGGVVMLYGAKILGTGMYHPPRRVTNHDLAEIMDTSDEWIQQRSGIVSRHFVDDGMTTSDLAFEASTEALERAGMQASELDMILVASFTSDHFFPGVSSFLQQKLGCDTTPAMDLKVQCTGFVYALKTAHAFIASGHYKRVLVVGAEVHSNGLEFSARGRDTAVLFGDGAGALIVGRCEAGDDHFLDLTLHAQGEHAKRLWMEAPGLAYKPLISAEMIEKGMMFPKMDGRFVFKHAVTRMPEVLLASLQKAELELDDIDHFLFHQANLRINQMVAHRLKIPAEKIPSNIERFGNTSAATLPTLLAEGVRDGKIKRGDTLAMAGFGSGFTWGGGVFRY
jgi:3-oxoacyl-[acyl-carrier-protein] synthase-3